MLTAARVAGLLVGHGLLLLAAQLLKSLSGIALGLVVSWKALLFSVAMGVLIPLLASLLPVLEALGRSILQGPLLTLCFALGST